MILEHRTITILCGEIRVELEDNLEGGGEPPETVFSRLLYARKFPVKMGVQKDINRVFTITRKDVPAEVRGKILTLTCNRALRKSLATVIFKVAIVGKARALRHKEKAPPSTAGDVTCFKFTNAGHAAGFKL